MTTDTERATLRIVTGWLIELSRLVRHGEQKPDKDQLAIYASMLAKDVPSGAFTTRSLHAVAQGLTWWPAYAAIRKQLIEQWQIDKPTIAPLLLVFDDADRLEGMDEHWLRYFETRQSEHFAALKPGGPYGREHVLSLIRQQSPKAWRRITGESRENDAPPTAEEKEHVANLLRPWREKSLTQ